MTEVRMVSNCEHCQHARVCNYAESKYELVDTLNKQLKCFEGTDYFVPEFFDLRFECREFLRNTGVKRDIKDVSERCCIEV